MGSQLLSLTLNLARVQSDLRLLFSHLCRDETPMVRRAAGQSLTSFAKIVEPEWVAKEFIPYFHHLTHDGALSVCSAGHCCSRLQ